MISEKWPLNIEIDKLVKHLQLEVWDKEKTSQSTAFGGWSVLSSNGDYRDGWNQRHLLLKESTPEDIKKQLELDLKKEFIMETEICTGYLKEIVEFLRNQKLNPKRARIICLTAGKACSWHWDYSATTYAVRLHVPIITNAGCFFETRDEREHMPADGSAYFVYVNREHRVVNHGSCDRYHLVVDVTDFEGLTKFHRLSDFKEKQPS